MERGLIFTHVGAITPSDSWLKKIRDGRKERQKKFTYKKIGKTKL